MRGPAQAEAHETRGEELNAGVHCTGARLESKVGVVEDDKADEADETVKSPDEEGDPEPVADPEDRREKPSVKRLVVRYLPRFLGVHVTTNEEKTSGTHVNKEVRKSRKCTHRTMAKCTKKKNS